jgi:ubiquinone/menaquinone biosynthesis C-methylase UbiE
VDRTIDTSYQPFSREVEYVELNRAFVESIDLRGCRFAVDVACGTGTLTELLWLDLRRRGGAGDPAILGVDVSCESLDHAVRRFTESRELGAALAEGAIRFVEGSAYALPVPSGEADLLVIGNAVHVFEEPERLLAEVARVLRPGGVLAFNSSFYAGTFAPGTERFYTEWMKAALAYIRREDADRRRRGADGVSRTKGLAAPAFSRPWLSSADYAHMLERCGFDVASVDERTVLMGRRAFERIGAYAGLASVLLSGYPVELACEALERAVGPALDAAGLVDVPRRWLELVATRRDSA